MDRNILCTGPVVIDIIAADLPRVSGPGEKTVVERGIKTALGGHPANLSRNLRKLGYNSGEVVVVAAVGHDSWEGYVQNELSRHRVTHVLHRVNCEMSKNLILIISGEDRRFHVDIRSNLSLDPERVMEEFQSRMPAVFYVGACGVCGRFDERLGEVLDKARSHGAMICADPAKSPNRGWDYFIPHLNRIDILHTVIDEASQITGQTDEVRMLKEFSRAGVGLAVITRGEEGLSAGFNGGVVSMGSYRVRAVDPTGAGDAFFAGLIYRFLDLSCGVLLRDFLSGLNYKRLRDLLLFAAATGACAVTVEGTTEGVSTEAVASLIEEQGESVGETFRVIE